MHHTVAFWTSYAIAMGAIAVACWASHKKLTASRAELARRKAEPHPRH